MIHRADNNVLFVDCLKPKGNTFVPQMQSRIFSIAIASTFLAGVAAWYGARFWAFGQFRSYSIIAFVLAIALTISTARGDLFSRLLTLAISTSVAYASFRLFFYMNSTDISLNSKEITGEAFLLPGVFFSSCSATLFACFVTEYFGYPRIDEEYNGDG